MTDARVLIIDDEPDIRHLIGIHLQDAGLHYTEAASGKDALTLLENQSFDLILLDLMMDDTDGLQALRVIRSKQNQTPIIILSAITEIHKKIETLGLGADDYVTKPFIPDELLARVKANIRRNRSLQSILTTNTIQSGSILLNIDALTVEKKGTTYPLSQTECDLLSNFMRHPGHTFSKEEIYEAVWKHDQYDANSLSVYINFLRRKIEDDPKSPQHIQTVRGIGYLFKEL